MLTKYLNILADHCKTNFEEMTKTKVMRMIIKKDERPNEIYAIAKVVSFEDIDQKLQGRFILGFTDEHMAVLVASAIATNSGLPPVTEAGEIASDILGEFINIIIGNAITDWDKVGLKVKFQPPISLELSSVKEKRLADTEAQMIILQLEIDHIAFRVMTSLTKQSKIKDKRILVVDDSHMIRGMLRNFLTENEAIVETAPDGLAAIEKFKTFHPDLIMMDINMPKLDGLEAIVQIQAIDPKARFVIISSSSRDDEVITAKMLKVHSYIIKPFKWPDLLQIITKTLDKP
ncbi:MAG: response regulator [Deltaproteobacteria bacterium]|nr:response regulator [Deltaproteobacteria bacterium]